MLLALSGGSAWSAEQDELTAYLAAQRRRMEDVTLDVAQRARVALEMAATLDRAAQSAPSAERRRARWAEAVALLDAFNAEVPRHPQEHELAFQAAVYMWAQARSWGQELELAPTDRAARDHAVELLDATIARLRALGSAKESDGQALDHNRRFRLSQAIADRASYEPGDSQAQRQAHEEALTLLESSFPEPGLQGFAHLLRSDLLCRLGQYDKARTEVKKAARLKPPPPPAALLEAQVAIGIGRKAFDETIETLQRSQVEDAERDLLAIRIRLAERAALPLGPERTEAESEAFRHAESLHKAGKAEARMALLALARSVDTPDESQGPEAWDLLAEGALAMGDPDRASALEVQGADKADAQGKTEQAATQRNRAGAMLFQAGRFAKAEALLARVCNDPQAGSVRPKAGMLRILALARGVAAHEAGCTPEAVLDALSSQLREFPNDPTAGEARWMLGKIRLGAGDRAEAIALWTAIPYGNARWLDARVAVAHLLQEALETQLINDDRAEAKRHMDQALHHLNESLAQARETPEQVELELVRARLELTPVVGRPDDVRQICERLVKTSSTVAQRDRAARLLIVALAQLGRFLDAERDARAQAEKAAPLDLLELARMLDQSAKATDSDLYRRRYGQLMRVVLARPIKRPDDLPPPARAEAWLRDVRGVLFSGNYSEARRLLQHGPDSSDLLADGLLDDLADTYIRLDAFRIAIDVYRLKTQRSRPGSLPWFAARYGLALAYYRAGQADEARRLIDATAILHPELGGGELRGKFEHLRQRIQHN